MKIQKEDIVELLMMRKYHQFTISLKTSEENPNSFEGTLDINSVSLRNYIWKVPKYKDYLSETLDHHQTKHRIKIVNMACDFLRSKKGETPNRFEKDALIAALYRLFPKLKRHDKQVLYGWITEKFCNDRRTMKKVRMESFTTKTSQPVDQEQNITIKTKIEFLKAGHVIIDEEKMKRYLKDTVGYRVHEIQTNNAKLNIKTIYNFFTLRPLYVCYFIFILYQ